MLTTKATIAASRITGSANMKTGIVPEVRVTTLIHILFFMFEGCTDICPHLSKGFPVVLEGRVYSAYLYTDPDTLEQRSLDNPE